MTTEAESPAEPRPPQRADRFRQLPERVRLEDTIASVDPLPVPDPRMGRDPERDFNVRTTGAF